MASKSARMRGSAHLKAVTVAHQKSYVISSVFCENSAAHGETATRLYLPIRAGRLHEWFLLLYVRLKKSLVLRFKGPRSHSETVINPVRARPAWTRLVVSWIPST